MEIGKLNKTLIFTHIPKTAGITFRSILYNNYPKDRINYLYQTGWNEIPGQVEIFEKEAGWQVITGHYPFGLHQYLQTDCDYVMFLRDPRKQVVSHYKHLLNSSDPIHQEKIREWKTFPDFVASSWGAGLQVRYISGLSPEEIRSDPQQALEKAKSNLAERNVLFGITEFFDESLLLLREKLGWDNINYIKRNVGKRHPAAEGILTPEVEAFILNSVDQALYTYAVKTFRERIGDIRSFRLKRAGYSLSQWRYRLATNIRKE